LPDVNLSAFARIAVDRPIPLGFNVRFDIGFLGAVAGTEVTRSTFSHHVVDVKEIVMFVEHSRGRFEPLRLGAACERSGVELSRAHDAMADITATVHLLRRLRRELAYA